MSKSAGMLVICAVILVTHMFALSFPAVDAAGDHRIGWIPTTASTISDGCRGSMAKCLAEGGDLDIDDMELSPPPPASLQIPVAGGFLPHLLGGLQNNSGGRNSPDSGSPNPQSQSDSLLQLGFLFN